MVSVEASRRGVDPRSPALFEGTIGHHRTEGADHRFRLGAFYAYLDVDTVEETLRPLPGWSATGPAPFRFRPEDHLDGSGRPIADAIRDLVEDRTGTRPGGRVLLLTQVRTLGFVFNPISVFYCWNEDGSALDAVVLEVTNTPWQERCWYVLRPDDRDDDGAWRVPKAMHVSPFLDMDLLYVIRAGEPGASIRLRIDDERDGATVFSAELDLRRVPLDGRNAAQVTLRHPLQTWRVFAAIHAHAIRLLGKGVPLRRHPEGRGARPRRRARDIAEPGPHAVEPANPDLAQPTPGGHPMAGPRPDRLAQKVLFAALHHLRGGRLTIVDRRGGRTFGDGQPDRYGRPPLEATIRVHDPAAYSRVVRQGSTGLGESYADGQWDADDLAAALRLIDRRVRPFDPALRSVRRVVAPVTDPLRRLRRQDPDRDRTDIQTHYDLGNEFFERLLDPTMMYSAARFSESATSLEEASIEKLDRLCRRLELGPSDHVLEIGTGWGGFAEHAASRYGCRVTTTTISAEQHRYATERIARVGLGDRVTVLDRDYRDLAGGDFEHRFDAIVSIEMIEAVDWREYDTFHRVCGRLLAPDGRLGMQAIVIPGQRYEQAKVRKDFIKTRIFPGGCLPSIEALLASSARVGDLTITDLEDFGLHYAETLRRWRQNLVADGDLGGIGLDEHFARLWDFYLAYCEAGFDERDISVVQLVLTRPGHRSGDLDGLSSSESGEGPDLHAVA